MGGKKPKKMPPVSTSESQQSVIQINIKLIKDKYLFY